MPNPVPGNRRMRISEAALQSRLSADTIRFYEREGLLQPIARSPQGSREFSAQDLRWLRLFERLRSTGMPLADMKRYADLAQAGPSTASARRQMLQAHLKRLDEQQSKIDACRSLVEGKIATYQSLEREQACRPLSQ